LFIVYILAFVSIIGLLGIVIKTIFVYNVDFYVESLWMLIIGLGLVIEARIKKLKSLSQGLTSNNVTYLTTIIIGLLAILTGIFSFPQIRVETPAFLAIKGIIGLIAIVFIVIQTWIVRS
jgi:hypothetical protein